MLRANPFTLSRVLGTAGEPAYAEASACAPIVIGASADESAGEGRGRLTGRPQQAEVVQRDYLLTLRRDWFVYSATRQCRCLRSLPGRRAGCNQPVCRATYTRCNLTPSCRAVLCGLRGV